MCISMDLSTFFAENDLLVQEKLDIVWKYCKLWGIVGNMPIRNGCLGSLLRF